MFLFKSGSRYNNYLIGDFNLLSTEDRLFQVQVRQIKCGAVESQVSCNCGVIVREGNNILGVTNCDNRKEPMVIKYLMDLVTPSGTIEVVKPNYVIRLLSGIEIKVVLFWDSFMNIYVKGLTTEIYGGLCNTSSTNFETFRIPLEQSFFQFSGSNPPKCVNETVQIPNCQCMQNKADRDSKTVTCGDIGDIMFVSKYVCGSNGRRRKRSVHETSENVISLDDVFSSIKPIDPNHTPIANPTWPTPNLGITQDQATNACNTGLRRSPAYELCRDKVDTTPLVQNCVIDIQLAEDLSIADTLATQLELMCQYRIESSIRLTDGEPDPGTQLNMEMLQNVIQVTCPSQCNQKGTCVNSTCICNNGFIGWDCSVVVGQTPTIVGLISERCNSRESTCTKIFVQAKNISNPENATCRITPPDNAVVYSVLTKMAGGTVSCPIPRMSALNFPSTIRLSVSISNDNVSFSNEEPFFAYDGSCMECPASTQCTQKSYTCVIQNRCYQAGEMTFQDSNKVCHPLVSANSWTDLSPQVTDAANGGSDAPSSSVQRNAIIIGVIVGFVLLVVVAVLFVFFVRKWYINSKIEQFISNTNTRRSNCMRNRKTSGTRHSNIYTYNTGQIRSQERCSRNPQ